jgi:hypothetical protein
MRDGELKTWAERLEGVLNHCDQPTPDSARLLRDTYALLCSAPPANIASHAPDISPATLQRLLDAGAFESLALRLAATCGWMMSSVDSHVIATVVWPQTEREHSFNASTVPVALCGALANSLKDQHSGRR